MKRIDLFNKLANGEIENGTYLLGKDWFYYGIIKKNDIKGTYKIVWEHKQDEEIPIRYFIGTEFKLYKITEIEDEVEIIEEEKEIKKIKSNGIEFYSDYINAWIKKEETVAYCEYLMNKINELIDAVNSINKGK